MPNPLSVPITPPRVAFIDARTGAVSREWYMFFLSLFTLVSGSNVSLDDLQKGPPTLTVDEVNSAIDKASRNLQPSTQSVVEQIAELRKQIEALEVQVRPELGTMAALQQANVPWLQFDTTPDGFPTGAAANGTVYWDDTDSIKTLNIVMEDSGEVIQHIGEETFYRVKATANITKGQVVMFTGTVGSSGGLLAAPATGLTATQSEYVMGVATQDIALNNWGYITWFGEVKKVNTTGGVEAWVDGQILYYNPAVPGGLTKTVPTAPNPKVIVASVVHAASNGILFVRPTFGSVLGGTDSNVQITSLGNGDLLQYDDVAGYWKNVSVPSLANGYSFTLVTESGDTLTTESGDPLITEPLSGLAPASTAPVVKTTNFTVESSDQWIINNKSGSSCTVTLPLASAIVGRILHFQNYQAQTLVSASSNVVPLAGGSAGTAILEAVSGANATLVSDGTNWIMTQYDSNNALQLE